MNNTLNPQDITSLNKVFGANVPTNPSATPSRSDEIMQIAKQAQQKKSSEEMGRPGDNSFGAMGDRAGTVAETTGDIIKGAYEGGKKLVKSLVAAPKTIATGVNELSGGALGGALGGAALTKPGEGTYAPDGTYQGDTKQKIEKEGQTPFEATLGSGSEGVLDAATAGEGASMLKDKVIPAFAKFVGDKMDSIGAKGAAVNTTESMTEAQKVQNPYSKYNVTQNQGMYKTGEIAPKGKGIFAKDVAAPKVTPQDEAVANLVDQGKVSSKNLPSQNISAIKQEARTTDSEIDSLIKRPELDQPFTQKTVDNTFNKVLDSAKQNRVFISDSAEEKAYKDVIDIAKEEVGKQSYNNAGLRNGIKSFNNRMEDLLGNDIYADAEGRSSSISQARIRAAKDVRSALNDTLAGNMDQAQKIGTLKVLKPTQARPLIEKAANFEKKADFVKYASDNMEDYKDTGLSSGSSRKTQATMNTNNQYVTSRNEDLGELWDIAHTEVTPGAGSAYKNALQKEAQLLNAADDLGFNARSGVGKTKLQMFVKAHPYITTGILGGGTAELLRKYLGI